MLLSDLDAVVLRDDGVEGIGGVDFAVHDFFVDDATGGDLSEHFQRVEPSVYGLETDFVVDGGDSDTLDVDDAAVGFGCDFLSLAVGS